ncbi:hypothetical protein AgCh_037014 [Apium graveolens]
MVYLARKFSNIRVKKSRYFRSKGQSFNKDNSWKEKGKYNFDSNNGYKIGSVDRSNISDDSRLVKTIAYPPHEDQAQINGGRIKTRQLDDETR